MILHQVTIRSLQAAMEARRYFVSGRVQGVGFRFFVEGVATELALTGYVRNRRDGRVEVYACGEAGQLYRLREQLGKGPPASRVNQVEEQAAPLDRRRGFEIETTV